MLMHCLLLACLGQVQVPSAPQTFTMQEAVSWSLALQRQVIAAELDVEVSTVALSAAKRWPNPTFNYSIGNLVLGTGNDQERDLRPSFGEQSIQTFAIEQGLDVWRTRWAKWRHARLGAQYARMALADVLREVVFATRTAFAEAAREQTELALAEANFADWQKSVTLMQRRLAAGDIASTDVAKFQLEALRATNALHEARMQHDLARQVLAKTIGMASLAQLPPRLAPPDLKNELPNVQAPEALQFAWGHRPDLEAARVASAQADAAIDVAQREALPPIAVGIGYTRSKFAISGDNPQTLGFTASVPLPVFERNQSAIAEARLARRQAHNSHAQLRLQIQQEVASALTALLRAQAGLACFEGDGMLEQAERAREVAHRALTSGAITLLDVLEAERTALAVKAEYLAMQHALNRASIDLAYVTAKESP